MPTMDVWRPLSQFGQDAVLDGERATATILSSPISICPIVSQSHYCMQIYIFGVRMTLRL